ncbi:MAG: DUF5640 domain-containing protein [Christensenellaceae bacterium]
MRKAIAIVLMAVLTVGMLAGCGNKEEDAVVGKWTDQIRLSEEERDENRYLEFKADGTIVFSTGTNKYDGTYTVEEDRVSIVIENEDQPDLPVLTLDGDTMTYDGVVNLEKIK